MTLFSLLRQISGLLATDTTRSSSLKMRSISVARRDYSTFRSQAGVANVVLKKPVLNTAVHPKTHSRLSKNHVSHPVLDFRSISKDAPAELRREAFDILDNAFRTRGFIYLSHHSIPQSLVNAAFDWVCYARETVGQYELRQLICSRQHVFLPFLVLPSRSYGVQLIRSSLVDIQKSVMQLWIRTNIHGI